ncbi:MAG TPA: ATP-binding protein, partial [Thermomicrobiales bacterium]|nr:ATP-binding protein [Thermomicrobiales bacterium]
MTERGAATGIVGRAREQAVLSGLLDDAIGGNGTLALLSGEAGIGKSTLAAALLAEAVARGTVRLAGGCYDLTITPPYGPWLVCLHDYRPEGDLPPVPAEFNDTAVAGLGGQTTLFDNVAGFLASVASVRPLVVMLEDLHWADRASLDLLRFVARRIESTRILILATYRSDEITRHHPLFQLLPLLTRESGA